VTTVAPTTTTLPPTTTTEAPTTTVAPTTTIGPAVLGVQLARTGSTTILLLWLAALALMAGSGLLVLGEKKVDAAGNGR
jgi:LPXTG-motif cell wall-anchored protein